MGKGGYVNEGMAHDMASMQFQNDVYNPFEKEKQKRDRQ